MKLINLVALCATAVATSVALNSDDLINSELGPEISKQQAPVCQVRTGTTPPTFIPNLKNLSAQDITNATLAWMDDVCTVNNFLNNSPRGIQTTIETVIAYANDEPTQFDTLASLPNLSIAGLNAAEVLKANFPMIPANLNNVKLGITTKYSAVVAINLMSCCTVLPAIDVLVREAATASGAFNDSAVPAPVRPVACTHINCGSGDSPGEST